MTSYETFKAKQHYEDFLNSEEKIFTKILAERLKRLKTEGYIKSATDKENQRKIIYSPTELMITKYRGKFGGFGAL